MLDCDHSGISLAMLIAAAMGQTANHSCALRVNKYTFLSDLDQDDTYCSTDTKTLLRSLFDLDSAGVMSLRVVEEAKVAGACDDCERPGSTKEEMIRRAIVIADDGNPALLVAS